MLSVLENIPGLLEILAVIAGIFVAILASVLAPSIVYNITNRDVKPKVRPRILWVIFYISIAIIIVSEILSFILPARSETNDVPESASNSSPIIKGNDSNDLVDILKRLDLDSYCYANGWRDSLPLNMSDVNSWICRGNIEDEKINMDLACQWQYSNSNAFANFSNENNAYSWSCYLR